MAARGLDSSNPLVTGWPASTEAGYPPSGLASSTTRRRLRRAAVTLPAIAAEAQLLLARIGRLCPRMFDIRARPRS